MHRELLPCSELCPSLRLVTYGAWRSPRSVLSFGTNIHLVAGPPVPLPRGRVRRSGGFSVELREVPSAGWHFGHLSLRNPLQMGTNLLKEALQLMGKSQKLCGASQHPKQQKKMHVLHQLELCTC